MRWASCLPWTITAAVLACVAATVNAASILGASVLPESHSALERQSMCGTALMQYVVSNSAETRCLPGGPQELALGHYLSRHYAACMELAQQTPQEQEAFDIRVVAPRNIARLVAELLTSASVLTTLSPRLLAYGVPSAHILDESLSDMSTSLTLNTAGWILPPWHARRLDMVQATADMPMDDSFIKALLVDNKGASGTPVVPHNHSAHAPGQHYALPPPPPNAVDQLGNWLGGIPAYYRLLASAGNPYLHHVPMDGSVNLLFFRSDVLKARGWNPPATWDELLVMAQALNGTDLNEDGEPDWGFCMEPVPDGTFAHLLGALLTPMTQSQGTSQGALLDAHTLKPLFNTPAFETALKQFAQLAKLSPPLEWRSTEHLTKLPEWYMDLCTSNSTEKQLFAKRSILSTASRYGYYNMWGSTRFHQGRCAFIVGTGQIWKVAQVVPPGSLASLRDIGSERGDDGTMGGAQFKPDRNGTTTDGHWYVRGRLGSSVLPGSRVVYNAYKGVMKQCDSDSCPHAELVTPTTQPATSTMDSHPAHAHGDAHDTAHSTEQSSSVPSGSYLVNRAPYTPTVNFVGTLCSEVPPDQTLVTSMFWMVAASELVHNELALSPDVPEITPMRSELLSLAALPRFVQAGYHAGDTASYIQAVLDTLAHPNIVPSPAIPGSDRIRELMHEGGHLVVDGTEPAAAAKQVQARVMTEVLMFRDDLSPEDQDLMAQYREAMMITYRTAVGHEHSPAAHAPRQEFGIMIVTVMIPVTCACIVVLLSIMYEVRKHVRSKSLLGKVLPPGAHPETTLMVTDIESSTTLWELLPPWVMDVTLQQHHNCIRTLMLKHSGYESATEGDSFLIAFHCPEDALLFAMECQVALLDCPWPSELLECEQCAPYYVTLVETGKKRLAPMGLGMLDDDGLQGERLTAGEYRIPEVPADLAGMVEPLPLLYTSQVGVDRNTRGSGPAPLPPQKSPLVEWPSFAEEIVVQDSSPLPSSPRPRLYSMEGGQSTASSPMGEHTFQTEMAACWKPAPPGTHNAFLIFRGLRVRMGMASGVHNPADVVHNKAAARTHYSGDILMTAKAVCDAASGGAVLLTEAACSQLPTQHLWDKALIMHIGEYILHDALPVIDLYQVTGRRLLGRIPHLNISKCLDVISRGVLAAPVGNVAVANVMAVGAQTLLSWNEHLAKEALDMFLSEVMQAMPGPNPGYLAEVHLGQMSITFPLASEAIVWGLLLHQALLRADWNPALLEQSVCEEVVVNAKLIFRGLRVKVGIDSGDVLGEIHPRTARCQYRGWPVVRSLRIMQAAASNQVLCSRQSWSSANLASSVSLLTQHQVTAEPFGFTKIKGLLDRLDLYQCRLMSDAGVMINKGRGGVMSSPSRSQAGYPTGTNKSTPPSGAYRI